MATRLGVASANREIRVRLDCAEIPEAIHRGVMTEFGVQNKTRVLHSFVRTNAGAYEFTVPVTIRLGTDAIDFAGPFVHGPKAGRFLYFGWRPAIGPDDDWIRRWKIDLSGIVPELIDRMGEGDVVRQECNPTPTTRTWAGLGNWSIERA